MKKRDIWINIAVIAAAVLPTLFYFRGDGRIEIDAGGAAAVLKLRSNWFKSTTITSGAGPTSACAGVHRPRRLSISTEHGGHTWRIDSRGPWGNLSRIRVKNLRTVPIRFGPPFAISTEVNRNGSVIDVDFAIVGQAGEHYRKFAVKGDREVHKTKVRIVDETGKIFEAGKVSYG